MFPDLAKINVEAYADAIGRFGSMLSLLSLLPVILQCRMLRLGGVVQRAMPPRQETEAAAKETEGKEKKGETEQAQGKKEKKGNKEGKNRPEQKEKKAAKAVAEEPETAPSLGATSSEPSDDVPLGLISVLLLIASEALNCLDLFAPLKPKKSGKGQFAGPFGALLAGIQKGGKQAAKNSKGSALDKVVQVINGALAPEGAFDLAHGALMVFGLVIILASLLVHRGRCIASDGSGVGDALKRLLRIPLLILAIVGPIVAFAAYHADSLVKLLRAFSKGGLLPSLQILLHMTGLVTAQGELALFSVLQVGSLSASLSTKIADGSLAKLLAPLAKSSMKTVAVLLDKGGPLLVAVVPTLLAMLWLSVAKLRKKPHLVVLTALLSVASTPLVVHTVWKPLALSASAEVAGMSKLSPMAKDKALGDMLTQIFDITCAMTSALIAMSGGTAGLVMAMLIIQMFVRIHGPEPFLNLLS